MEKTYEKTVIHAAKPTEKTVVHTEKKAVGEIDNIEAEQQAEQQAGGILESVKAAALAGVETVRDGVNYIADRVTGNDSTTATEATTISPPVNPQVDHQTRIIKEQTTYPNQQGYGVNPKFKEDHDSGALSDIKSGLKKGVENIKETANNFKEDVKDGARELKDNVKEGLEDVKIQANKMANPPPPTYAEKAACYEAKAHDILDDRDKELHKAAKAQAKANEKAFEADVKTAKAINKHEIGQEYLAQAGAEMQHAGAQMQYDARRY
uniref:Uncharacterized protein n=1 Tax=Panagrolaimus superbus TaxID=310955 RepID=A0A914YSD1_9BILA